MPVAVRSSALFLAVALAFAACATPIAVAPAPVSPVPTARPSSSAPDPTPVPALRLVGLGDSVAGAGHCGGCRSYVLVFGEIAAKALGDTVATTNLGSNNDLGSDGLLAMVTSDPSVRDEISRSDLITIDIGWNDWQGPCFWDGLVGCLERGQASVERNLDKTLAKISRLRAGQPTVVRVVTYADPYVGDPHTPEIFEFENTPENVATFEQAFTRALHDFNAMLCRVAQAHEAACVDLVPAFNGLHADTSIPGDHRDSQAQMDLIAHEIDKAGYAPLR